MPFSIPFPAASPGDLPLSRGKAHYNLSQGQHVAVRVNSNLCSAPLALALGRVILPTLCFTQWNINTLLHCSSSLASGSRMEDGTGQSWEGRWLWQFSGCFSTLSSLFPEQVCALPVAAAVTQLGKCVNSNWLILTHCSISETGYLTNECQMLSLNSWIALLLPGKCYDSEVRVL